MDKRNCCYFTIKKIIEHGFANFREHERKARRILWFSFWETVESEKADEYQEDTDNLEILIDALAEVQTAFDDTFEV